MGIHSYFTSSNNNDENNKHQSDMKNIIEEKEYFKGPKCHDCSNILLITKLDIINMTIDFKCDNCFKVNKENIPFYNFLEERIISQDKSDKFKKCEIHNKPYTYFCETCFRHNCDDCFEKTKYPKHKFFDLYKNKISKSKINKIYSRIVEEKNSLNKLLNNIKFELEKYKNKYPIEKLFMNKNFERILIINIKEKIKMIELKKLLIDNYINIPNNFLNIQNVNYIYQLNKIEEGKLYEELIKSTIKNLKDYENHYLFKYMESKTFNYEVKNREEYDLNYNYLSEDYNQLPFIHIENTDLIIFIDFNILCINIKTGKLIYSLSITNNTEYNKYPYCSLTNNTFLIFGIKNINKYEFSESTIKKIDIYFNNHSFDRIYYIYKLFNEHYLLIENYVFYEKEMNHYEKILEVKDVKNLMPINYLRKSNEEYFIGRNNDYNCIIIKFIIDKNNNSINYYTEKLNFDFLIFSHQFINDTHLLFETGFTNNEEFYRFIIYDLKNKTIICEIHGEGYNQVLNNVIPKIKNIYKSLKLKYSLKSDLPFGYKDIYPLMTKDGEYFIGKNYKSKNYEFKIFKYDI